MHYISEHLLYKNYGDSTQVQAINSWSLCLSLPWQMQLLQAGKTAE